MREELTSGRGGGREEGRSSPLEEEEGRNSPLEEEEEGRNSPLEEEEEERNSPLEEEEDAVHDSHNEVRRGLEAPDGGDVGRLDGCQCRL